MNEYWFRPKERGYGAGMPIHWMGWVWLAAYLAAVLSVPWAMTLIIGNEGNVALRLAAVAAISVPFIWIAKVKTEGGWRWRNGGDET